MAHNNSLSLVNSLLEQNEEIRAENKQLLEQDIIHWKVRRHFLAEHQRLNSELAHYKALAQEYGDFIRRWALRGEGE